MRHRMWSIVGTVLILAMLVMPATASPPVPAEPKALEVKLPSEKAVAKLPRIAVGAEPLPYKHLRAPREDIVVQWLEEAGAVPEGYSRGQVEAAVAAYYDEFYKRNPAWLSPGDEEEAMQREVDLASQKGPLAIQPVTATVFALAVDFGISETITAESWTGAPCATVTQTVDGPLNGDIPYPGPLDNNTIWYDPSQTADLSVYEDLTFGYTGAGRVRFDLTDPEDHLPGVNLAGYTVQDYYDYVAGDGNVIVTGTVEGWVTVPHSEGRYGAPNCPYDNDGGGGVPVGQLVVDALEVFSDTHPGYYTDTTGTAFWPKYDANGDGVLDTMWIIHAGMGEEAGGGYQGEFAIWSHSWSLSAQGLSFKVYEGDVATTTDDIYVNPYTMQPEHADLGVLVEEFGHNFFHLPDLYTTDGQNSVGFWTEMSGGSWCGYLGGAMPSGMPLWFRMIAQCGTNPDLTPIYCNWQEPMITRDYDDPAATVEIGQLEGTPAGVDKGLRINLPNILVNIPNNAGSGKGAWAESTNYADRTLERQVLVTTGALTVSAYWDLESYYDFGYLMVNGTIISDTSGYMTDYDPYGSNLGWGLTGNPPGGTSHDLTFDLSDWAGGTVTLTFRLVCDPGVNWPGFWIDNVRLDGALVDDFTGATAPATFPGWSNDGWQVVPVNKSYESYYLVEWRAPTRYDRFVRTAYVTTYADEDEWRVERVPYNIPGALLYYRNQRYPQSYSQRPTYNDPPSYGPKSKLLVIDTNYMPMWLGTVATLNSRASSYDSALTLQPTDDITLSEVYGVSGGPWNFPSHAGVTEFHDALGYYPGFYYGPPCPAGYICYAHRDASVVVPSQGLYSTRVTDFSGNPAYGWYWMGPVGPSWLGPGDPGADWVQYGVHIELLDKAVDDSTATLGVWHSGVGGHALPNGSWYPYTSAPGATFWYTGIIYNWGQNLESVLMCLPLDTEKVEYVGASPGVVGLPSCPEPGSVAPGDLQALQALADADAPVGAVAWSGILGSGDIFGFGYQVRVLTYFGTVESHALFYGPGGYEWAYFWAPPLYVKMKYQRYLPLQPND